MYFNVYALKVWFCIEISSITNIKFSENHFMVQLTYFNLILINMKTLEIKIVIFTSWFTLLFLCKKLHSFSKVYRTSCKLNYTKVKICWTKMVGTAVLNLILIFNYFLFRSKVYDANIIITWNHYSKNVEFFFFSASRLRGMYNLNVLN